MTKFFFPGNDICLLPYPDGKTFAFTIIDDTDASTLESVRPIYDYLFSLGLRTTKTVWARRPNVAPDRTADTGDSLEREDYAEYIRLLRRRGFEIALHNVSSRSNKRSEIAAGLVAFRNAVMEAPQINVQHEKNLENMYFDFAQSGCHLPAPYKTVLFRTLHKLLRPSTTKKRALTHGCSGENPESEYFWGDLCKSNIKYVRTNVFFQDLNTLNCSPLMPYTLAATPYVNYWFDSSNGQDVHQFNLLLSDKNIRRLRRERGCSILYTHFGKGFVKNTEGRFEINTETKQRLQAIAGHPDGWYVTVTELLDRLLAFQRVTVIHLPGGMLITNHNKSAISSVTVQTAEGKPYSDLTGQSFTVRRGGQMVIPVLPAGASTIVVRGDIAQQGSRWYEQTRPGLLLDIEKVARRVGKLSLRRAIA